VHVVLMGLIRNAYAVLLGKLEVKRPLERPRIGFRDNIKVYL